MADRESWQLSGNAAEIYEEYFAPAIFAGWAPRVADAAGISAGDRVLDVACGTGVVTRECVTRAGSAGKVIGLDLNEGMLTVARRVRPEIEWRQGDAAELPFEDGAFDAVVCQFALMFFPDRAAALREMWRVLAPGGRLAIAVWGAIEEIEPYVVLAELAGRHGGSAAADIVKSPFVLGDTGELVEIFRDAGLDDVKIDTRQGLERFASLTAFVEIEIKGTPAAACFDEAAYAALAADAPEHLAFCLDDKSRVEFANTAHIVTARKS